MYKVRMRESAQDDLEKIYKFCSNISISYAIKVKIQIISYIKSLQVFPKGYPKIYQKNLKYEYRKIPIERYMVVYLIHKGSIIIVRIFDTRRNLQKF